MRELKFRVWQPTNNFVYFGLSKGNSFIFESTPCIEQYTGLKDKNGKEIYEGDIVEKDGINYWIKWEDGCFVICRGEKYISFVVGGHAPFCEVIGNMHENHELLEQDNAKD